MFQTIWKVSLFLIPVILLLGVCSDVIGKRYGVRRRYFLWMLLAVRLCLPISFSLPLPAELPFQRDGSASFLEPSKVFVLPQGETVIAEHTIELSNGAVVNKDPNSSYQNPIAFFKTYPEVLWKMGVCGFFLWQGGRYCLFRLRLRKERREVRSTALPESYAMLCREIGLQKQPALYVCETTEAPFCVGFFRSEIYMRSEESEQIEWILRHELLHCKRRDIWAKGLLLVVRGLHFFNPFVHWMAKMAERDLESACDLEVVQHLSLAEREHYSMAILQTIRESKRSAAWTTAFSGTKEVLKKRFAVIFEDSPKKRGTALYLAAVLVLTAAGCTPQEVQQPSPNRSIVYGAYTEDLVHELYAAKLPYIGDHIGVGKIWSLLPRPEGVTGHEQGMELFTTEPPYRAVRHLQWQEGAAVAEDTGWIEIHGILFLALVENAEEMTYIFHPAGEENAEDTVSYTCSRDGYRAIFGETDLRSFAETEEGFRQLVLAVNRYYYEGIETTEERNALSEWTEAEQQERMTQLLAGGTLATETTDKSMLYQMISADSLAYALAEQQRKAPTGADFRDTAEYQEILAIGEPALRTFLSSFARGIVGDGLEGEILRAACQDLLGEEQTQDVLPTEWYRQFVAKDPVVLPAFRYEEAVYTADVRDRFSFLSAGSIAEAGEDSGLRAVYDAMEEKYNAADTAGQMVTLYSPVICERRETKDTLEVFAVLGISQYTLTHTKEGYALVEAGGSNVPAKLCFTKKGEAWKLTEWIEAKDGNLYQDSIEAFCDGNKRLAKKMMQNEGTETLLWQNMIYYLKGHFGDLELPIYQDSYMEADLYQRLQPYLQIVLTYETETAYAYR